MSDYGNSPELSPCRRGSDLCDIEPYLSPLPALDNSSNDQATESGQPLEHSPSVTFPVNEIYPVSSRNLSKCRVFSKDEYDKMYRRSIQEPQLFWGHHARKELRWINPFTIVSSSTSIEREGSNSWFLNGKLNVCDNCVDRWAEAYSERIAIIWEGDEPTESRKFSYKECLTRVCRMANLLKRIGVRKFDTVAIYLPVVPEAVFAMLACARIGAVHVFIFGGFSAHNLRDRLHDAHCKFLITLDVGKRGGRSVYLKKNVDIALKDFPLVEKVVVFQRPNSPPISTDPESKDYVAMTPGRDIWGGDMLKNQRPYCPLETMDAEDALFLLHTSGSTGKPKGILHTTGGYILYAAMTHKYIFDHHDGDVFACVADIGWITGHTYTVYGPLCNGGTTILFESIPTYPADGSRYWSLIEKYKVNQFYTSPTAVRTLMRLGDDVVRKHNLTSLRIIGSVGEPINAEAWRWLHNVVGNGNCNIVDTYWQTETGGICLTPLPGAILTKPGSATLPFFGIDAAILDPMTGKEIIGNNKQGVLCFKKSWPGMLRTIYGDHLRLNAGYYKQYPNYFYTGDGAYRDIDGYYWIKGRIDDVMNVAGHRFSSAELENALAKCPLVSESAVVSIPHSIKGSGICCLVVLKKASDNHSGIVSDLKGVVRAEIGPVATPDVIFIVRGLPKTRSGKVVRRLIRKIVNNECSAHELGDTSTLADPSILDELIHIIHERETL